jgi:hypothetical protein
MGKKRNASSLISDLKRKTRKAYNSEEKIRIVIEGIPGELSIAELCRREGIHPQTQGKIKRYHRSMKNVVKLDNYYSPGQLESKMKQFVQYYNYVRYHESINNLTPSEVYHGTGERKLRRRKRIKQQTLIERKKQNQNIYLN